MTKLFTLSGYIFAVIIAILYEYQTKNLFRKPKNEVHFYVARDHDYSLNLYLGKPKRACYYFLSCANGSYLGDATHFQRFGLNYKDFKDLKWGDEPVEVFVNMEN